MWITIKAEIENSDGSIRHRMFTCGPEDVDETRAMIRAEAPVGSTVTISVRSC